MKVRLTLPLLLLAGLVTPHAATAQEGYTGTNMKFLYIAEVIGNADPLVREQLTMLHNSGINVIPVSGLSLSEVRSELATVRNDPLLSQFKVVLTYNGPIFNAWHGGEAAACTPGSERLPSELESDLGELAGIALQNSDIVVGYYTFDEPALPKKPMNRGICKRYQELVYQRIRQVDPDSEARPIIMANTMWNLDDAQIQYGMSAAAQDVVFVDQYAYDLQSQINYYRKWQQHGFLRTGMVPVLPAGDPALRSSFRPTVESALQSVYGSDRPRNMGSAYFAYWPFNRPDFDFDGNNCPAILSSVVDDLSHQPDLQVMRVETVPAQFLPGQSVRFRAVIQNTGNAPSPLGLHSVLVHENGRCFAGGCQWGMISTSLMPGEQVTIALNQGPEWQPSAGLHPITAFVDDADRLKESNEHNNETTREIVVGDKPDLLPYLIESVSASFKPGDQVGFRVAVTNRGSMPAAMGWLGAVYQINGACPQTGCPWSGLTGALQPGESVWLPAAGPSWPAVSGLQNITVIVDDQKLVAEADESNNQLSRQINVSDKPDLRIVDAYSRPARPRAGDATSFVATVENVGSTVASAAWIGLLATENNQCFSQSCVWGGLQNAALAPGSRSRVSTYYGAWSASPGAHTIQLIIDDQNTVSESREDNNSFDLPIRVD